MTVLFNIYTHVCVNVCIYMRLEFLFIQVSICNSSHQTKIYGSVPAAYPQMMKRTPDKRRRNFPNVPDYVPKLTTGLCDHHFLLDLSLVNCHLPINCSFISLSLDNTLYFLL